MGKDNQKAYQQHSELLKTNDLTGFSNEVVDFRFIITQQVFHCLRFLTNAEYADEIEKAVSAVNIFEVTLKSCFNKKQLEEYTKQLNDLDKNHGRYIKTLKSNVPIERSRKRYAIHKLGILLKHASALGLTFVKGVTDVM